VSHATFAEGKMQVSMAICEDVQLEFMADLVGCAVMWSVGEAS